MLANHSYTMSNYVEEGSDNEVPVKDSREHQVDYKWILIWQRIIFLTYFHLAGIYGLYLAFFYAKLWTILSSFVFYIAAMLGTTAGCHRLWSHRSYKAKWPMKLILTIFQTAAFQGPIYVWVRDHRLHHKFTDTNADPYNALRGFFFSHIGWALVRKHPCLKKRCYDRLQGSRSRSLRRLSEEMVCVFDAFLLLYSANVDTLLGVE